MSRSEFSKAFSLIAGLALASLVLGGSLTGCSSTDEETAADLPQPHLGTKQYEKPAIKRSGTQPTLGRVAGETQRRRQVIRQLESIFQSPQP